MSTRDPEGGASEEPVEVTKPSSNLSEGTRARDMSPCAGAANCAVGDDAALGESDFALESIEARASAGDMDEAVVFLGGGNWRKFEEGAAAVAGIAGTSRPEGDRVDSDSGGGEGRGIPN